MLSVIARAAVDSAITRAKAGNFKEMMSPLRTSIDPPPRLESAIQAREGSKWSYEPVFPKRTQSSKTGLEEMGFTPVSCRSEPPSPRKNS